MNLLVLGACGALTGVSSYGASRYFSTKFVEMGITGKDIHKSGTPVTAEMGGLAALVGLLIGSAAILASGEPPSPYIAGAATLGGVGLVGMADDLTDIRQRYKPFLVAATSIPLIYILWQRSSITIPFAGTMSLGYVYPLAVIPFAITISSNFTNMLAGFNGLEAGCAIIAIGSLTLLAAVEGSYPAALLGVVLVCAFLGFFKLNWYPARIFPGDTGTLLAGAGIAAIGLLGGLEFAAIVVSIPAGIDFALKMIARRPFAGRHVYGNTTVDGQGRLKPPTYPALVHAFMRAESTGERSLVLSVLGMEGFYSLLAVALTLGFR